MIKPMLHQQRFAEMWGKKGRVLNLDGCGTGKTMGCVFSVKQNWPDARVLVLAPLSILETAWKDDINTAWPESTVAIADGGKARKLKAFDSGAQWVVTNHDTIKLVAEMQLFRMFDVIIVDEADAFRNMTSQRTKALLLAANYIKYMSTMTATPTPKSVTDIFTLALMTDHGERLGRRFTKFREQVCDGYPIYGAPPGAMKWVDKPEATSRVMTALGDIMTRVTLDDVAELPDVIYENRFVELPTKIRSVYERLEKDSIIEHSAGELNAINAAARINKMLQTVSGAVYNEQGDPLHIHTLRNELAVDLALETDHALIAYNWTHQLDGMMAYAKKKKVPFAVINGSVPAAKRTKIVNDFQAGKYRFILAHPQSAGHGLTLTRANLVVWSSPTYRTDLYEQFNHRIIRNGQKRKTRIAHIMARNSVEEIVYEKQQDKRCKMFDLLDAVAEMAKAA